MTDKPVDAREEARRLYWTRTALCLPDDFEQEFCRDLIARVHRQALLEAAYKVADAHQAWLWRKDLNRDTNDVLAELGAELRRMANTSWAAASKESERG